MRNTEKLTLRSALTTLLFLFLASSLASETLVVAVRHAEKETGPSDPKLTKEGAMRAEALARSLADLDIAAIYSTAFHRTRLTAAPLAKAKGLEVRTVPAENHAEVMAKIIRERHENEVVVVVGHSNTTPALAAALGVENPPEISEATYDRLFIVRLTPNGAHLLPLRYGRSGP